MRHIKDGKIAVTCINEPKSLERWPPRTWRGIVAQGSDPEQKIPQVFKVPIVENLTHGVIYDRYILSKDKDGNLSYNIGKLYERTECEKSGCLVFDAEYEMNPLISNRHTNFWFSGGTCDVCGKIWKQQGSKPEPEIEYIEPYVEDIFIDGIDCRNRMMRRVR